MNIALISVAPPYRGGISKHTTILQQKLSLNHTVDIINYSRQYPEIFFPGKSQYLPNTSNFNTEFRFIDTVNPFSWFKTAQIIKKKKYDLIIFRFWNPFFAPALGVIAGILKFQSSSAKLISLCDNIIPHEKLPLTNYLIKFLFNKLDGHIVQSSQTEKELKQIVSSPIYVKCFHPNYNTYGEKINKSVARQKLKLNKNNIILYFGIIRDYKGLEVLINSLHLLKLRNNDFHLLIAGECYGNKNKYLDLIKQLKLVDYITWQDEYIPDDQVVKYFSATDVVVLPYRSASQSGIAQIAYHYNIPIIVSDIEGLKEVVENGKSGFIFKSGNSAELSKILHNNFENSNFVNMSNYILDYKKIFSWDKFCKGIEELFDKI
jgi:glycosyltransferase involved in cell wall biosynthesis